MTTPSELEQQILQSDLGHINGLTEQEFIDYAKRVAGKAQLMANSRMCRIYVIQDIGCVYYQNTTFPGEQVIGHATPVDQSDQPDHQYES